MRKEKRKTSSRRAVEFPAKYWNIYFSASDEPKEMIPLGRLNLVETENETERYVGAMYFHDDPQFGDVRSKPFPVSVIYFDPQSGAIEFQIMGAATLFAPDTPVQFQFVFTGAYEQDGEGEMWLHGQGRVPQGFCPQTGKAKSGLPGDDGEDVIWRSGGPTEPPHKRSK